MKKSDKLIILDIDETLFHCDILPMDNYDYTFKLGDKSYFCMKRPYLNEFIEYISKNFSYGIYTAASEDYAIKHCEELKLNPSFLLHRENCTIKNNIDSDFSYYLKKLSKLKKYTDLSKMIAIDDRLESFQENYDNLIKVKPFYCDYRDDVLLKLIEYLEKLKEVDDVRKIEKRSWYS